MAEASIRGTYCRSHDGPVIPPEGFCDKMSGIASEYYHYKGDDTEGGSNNDDFSASILDRNSRTHFCVYYRNLYSSRG